MFGKQLNPYDINTGAYLDRMPEGAKNIGAQLEEGTSIEEWIKAAGLDFEYKESVVSYFNEKGETDWLGRDNRVLEELFYPERKVLYRSDTLTPLSVVSEGYHVVQPREILEFYQSLSEEAGFRLSSAGTLGGGKKIWALARTGVDIDVDSDKLQGYLLLATSCDKTLATTALFTTLRILCLNILHAMSGNGVGIAKVNHMSAFDPHKVKVSLGMAKEAFEVMSDNIKVLKERKTNDVEAMEFIISTLGGDPTDINEYDKPRLVKRIYEAYKDAPGSENSAWGLVNAFTYDIDHVRGRSDATRTDSSWFGAGAKMKKEAFNAALMLAA